ncbi:hypothetical protein [Arcticibacter sp. MXS-1]|uniref:hypothetical protein n=1 Tax=Arcticibacter sp. MXS-1 TaxID=3341726 RepID=UPI0035A91714
MKKVIFYSSILLAAFLSTESKAQVHVDVNIGQPAYVAPVRETRYYYLPDAEAYYYVPKKVYYYRHRGDWVRSAYLPGYRNYNVYNVRHVVVNEERPYLRHDYYRSRYNIRDNYYVERVNYKHGKWKKSHTHRGRGRH